MNILIVDDEPLARNELTYLLNQIGGVQSIAEAETVADTLEALLLNTFDVVFLDINLMHENGIELAKKIKKMKQPPHIIFATAHDSYAVQAFEVNATDYILKPFDQKRIEQALNKVVAVAAHEPKTPQYATYVQPPLPVEVEDRIHMLPQSDIIAISVNQGVTTIYTTGRQFETTETLNAYAQRLDDTQFLRIHRAHIINRARIQSVEHSVNYTYIVKLDQGVKLQVSRSYMKTFKQAIGLT